MSAEIAGSMYPDLPGFAKENRELVYAMVEAGWKGRITSKGHFLAKAPDGKTQITVPAKNGANRGLKNASAAFLRWLKAHAPAEEQLIWDAAKGADPIVQDVIADGLVRKQTQRLVQENMQRAHEEFIEMIKADPRVTIEPLIRPWMARKQPTKSGGQLYESHAVLERVWPDGRPTDYACSMPDCDYTAARPQSVARHYGAGHTRKGAEPAQPGPTVPTTGYTEPTTTRDYRPTQRLVDALKAVLDGVIGQDTEQAAIAILTWMNERPDIEHTERPLVPLTDRQVLDKIRMLVGQPDQSDEIEALRAENLDLANQITRLQEERAALRELLS